MVKPLSIVSDIPKQYRWTKKPAPTGFSSYLESSFEICELFQNQVSSFNWSDEEIAEILKRVVEQSIDVFCERAEKVLESVEQTGSSLQRFKKKFAPADGQEQLGDSDDLKIRRQIVFDANFMKQRAIERAILVDRLERIEQRGNSIDLNQNLS